MLLEKLECIWELYNLRQGRSPTYHQPISVKYCIEPAKERSLIFITLPFVIVGSLAPICSATAQITEDNSLDATGRTSVTRDVLIRGITSDRIDDGTTRGSNLFHSFAEFNVGANRGVYFSNPAGIENILTRVTGTNRSNIQGRLGVLGNANLFFINPNGIIFGPNARLDVGGSFIGSTADSIQFADGSLFSTKVAESTPLLTVSIPVGLQMRANPESITMQGVSGFFSSLRGLGLIVPPGKTLALVGGDITLEGAFLNAPGGRIELGSVAGNSLVNLSPTNQGWTVNYQGVKNFRNIQISRSFVDISIEDNSGIPVIPDKGNIAIRASVLDIGRSSIVRANTFTSAPGGDINIDVQRLTIREGAFVSSRAFDSGAAGNLTVNASEEVQVIGTTSGLFVSGLSTSSEQGATGAAGNLTINTSKLLVRDGAVVSTDTYGSGQGGNLTVNATDEIQVIGTSPRGQSPTKLSTSALPGSTGTAGDLTINTATLIVRDGAQIGAGTFGAGNGGNLTVNASKKVLLTGSSITGQFPSGLFTSAQPGSTGAAGDITINTPTFKIQDGAGISVRSRGKGFAGNLNINADSIRLENKGTITAEASSGSGGDIYLNVQDYLLMGDESIISATALDGDGGNIFINDNPNYRGFLIAPPNENNDITANAGSGQGGKVVINSAGIFGFVPRSRQDLERLRPNDLDPRRIPTNDITAVSQQNPSLSGSVTLNTPEVDPSKGLVELPETVVDPTEQIAQNPCQRGDGSQFIITGRGGLPPHPNEILSNDNIRVDWIEPVGSRGNSQGIKINQSSTHPTAKQIVPAQGWVFNEKGDVVLTAYNPTATNLPQRTSSKTTAACPAPF
ncbi:beta strand repeat-containing protein [Chlorogloeopsis fritschii]|uniref:beta strand repeat-containing protein n=1 Tax=Chlorogloeopsis fritschii TaxID=1124 RepID=UPI0023F12016|nr:S-layer family protein [Chlorogloeopsis fritschii]